MSAPRKGREKIGVVLLAAVFTGMLFLAHLFTAPTPSGPPVPRTTPGIPARPVPGGVEVYLDQETGCEYLVGPGITPRRDATGRQICRPPDVPAAD